VRPEPATILVVELGSIGFFFLVMPLLVVLSRLPRIWLRSRAVGLILAFIVVLTGVLFALYLVAIAIITFTST
jgi:hypothetical protein